MSLSWCCRPLQCQILLSWQGDVRMVKKNKLQETAGSHNNFVPLEALPTGTPLRCPKSNPSMLSEMYHRIIPDSQLCDSTLNHGLCNHLTNIYPLPTTQKRYRHQARITRKARGIVARVWSAVSMELWMLSEMNCTKPLPGKMRYVKVDGSNICGSLPGMFL